MYLKSQNLTFGTSFNPGRARHVSWSGSMSMLGIMLIACFFYDCRNRDINEGEEFQPREIHEDIPFHFSKITVDGVEYLILEKDNNNPHEGFGFMAFRANKLIEKQDTVMAYLQTINEFQTRIYAKLFNMTVKEAEAENKELLLKNLLQERKELDQLQKSKLSSEDIQLPEKEKK